MYIHHTSIRNFVPWKTHRIHLTWLIHQKNLKIPALDTKHSQRSLNQNPADGYLPKVVETQEVQRFSEFFFNCLKPSTLSNSSRWQASKCMLTLSKSDFGSQIDIHFVRPAQTLANRSGPQLRGIKDLWKPSAQDVQILEKKRCIYRVQKHYGMASSPCKGHGETHFLFIKSTEAKNALSLWGVEDAPALSLPAFLWELQYRSPDADHRLQHPCDMRLPFVCQPLK